MTRFNNWAASEMYILMHEKTNASFTVAHNKLSDWSQEEVAMLRGRIGQPGPIEQETEKYAVYADVPASKDWRDEGAVTPIKDQGQCGSCWTFGTTGTMEGAVFLQTGTLYSFSEQHLVDCVTSCYGCGGGLQTFALAYLRTSNAILEEDYTYTATGRGTGRDCQYDSKPHTDFHTEGKGWVQVEQNNVQAIKEAVNSVPVTVALDASGSAFQLYSGGVYDNSTSCAQDSNDHATGIIGWTTVDGVDCWIMRNSWGTTWGDEGYMYVKITGDDAGVCGIQTDIQYPSLAKN
jgi:C1A family cysteine protease